LPHPASIKTASVKMDAARNIKNPLRYTNTDHTCRQHAEH